jgi:adenylosuccinate lyase
MELNTLMAVSPIDGRYSDKTKTLGAYFSEYALIQYRVEVEIEYLIFMSSLSLKNLRAFSEEEKAKLREIYSAFSISDAEEVKKIEMTTNHDVKAVEYFIKAKVKALNIDFNIEFIHFGLTSQDINNTAIPLSLKRYISVEYINQLGILTNLLSKLSTEWKDIPMLAKTHGQPASPTSLGKEIFVFVERLNIQMESLKQIKYAAKFGGATGNFNAHKLAFPQIDWRIECKIFIETLGLERSTYTTQIEHYDSLAALCDVSKRINTILIDLCRDIWQYISMEYFKQKIKEGEIGSSAMPHKVNPIDFENGEGNLGIANAIFEHLSAKLPISRLQRDLTDSTVLRNIGVPYAHTSISLQSITRGLYKLIINKDAIEKDLNDNWAVVAEAIQTVLRAENVPNPYEQLKDLTRKNTKITQEGIGEFIDSLAIPQELKEQLKSISPFNYIGYTLDEPYTA